MRRLLIPLLIGLAALAGAFDVLSQRIPRPLHLPPQQPLTTHHPTVGVHTRLAGIGDERYISETLQLVHDMGAAWIVELFPWIYVQPRNANSYDWTGADLIINHARARSLQVIARLDFVPEWARPERTFTSYIDPEHYGDFASYVAAFARRYRPLGVRHLLIWNEPNLSGEWGGRQPDPEAYAELLKVVYRRVKQEQPDAIIIAAGLSPGGPIDGGATRMDDLEYLRRMVQAGAPFDMLAAHPYSPAPPDEPPAPEVVSFRRPEIYHTMLQELGRGDVPIVITEAGWNDHPRWSAAVPPDERIRRTLDAYRIAEGWPWLVATCMWQFNLPSITHSYQDNWTFVAPDLITKPIYDAVRRWARGEEP
ncbi:MAG: hypothetical protein KatS3mg057_2133 [Herpetosiphonaceae bacterium]|nr:MAG: hypothetical protein KatS3mg057_2133 [Herpetosiphonaceae bacterium]